MAQVFLSYDREDGSKARAIAQALESAGHLVWWDLHIKGGAEYGKVIEEALEAAEAVVVLWSKQSVASAWVRDEAAAGRDKGCLVPVLLEAVNPPMGFRQYQSLDLSAWKGRGKPPRMAELLDSIDAIASAGAKVPVQRMRPSSAAATSSRGLPKWLLAGGAVMVALIILGPFLGLVGEDKDKPPAVAIAAAGEDAASKSLARDLLVKLGTLQAARQNALVLMEGGTEAATNADLLLEVESSTANGRAEANLVLTGGKDQSLLWSRDFEQPATNKADLEQQVAYTAALVLQCGSEALMAAGSAIDQATLKLYLNACAELSNSQTVDPRGLIPSFEAIIKKAPRFEGAWARLLLAESEAYINPDFGDPDVLPKLKRDIAAARSLNPHMAETYIAEALVLPPTDVVQRMKLLDEGVTRNPENPVALGELARALQNVGRMREAVGISERAIGLDPISPAWRDSLVSSLTYSGQFDRAREELARADKFWPGASNLVAARYRLLLRYGDPREALQILNSGRVAGLGDRLQRSFLEARIDPTPAKIEMALSFSRTAYRRYPPAMAIHLQGLGAFDREEEAIPDLLRWRTTRETDLTGVLFRPALRELHRDARFMAIANRFGLVEYWRMSGKWPDFCFEPDLPYDCKAEAAKLN